MNKEEWSTHIEETKKYSILNELDYATAWKDGHTLFIIKGKLYLKPRGSRFVQSEEMDEMEQEALLNEPGMPFMAVQAI